MWVIARLLKRLPDTPERARQELTLQLTLGPALIATRGYGASEVEATYTRALSLCEQAGETSQRFSVQVALRAFYQLRAQYDSAKELGKVLLTQAEHAQDPVRLVEAHRALGTRRRGLPSTTPNNVMLMPLFTGWIRGYVA
jgi:hypothetical protein